MKIPENILAILANCRVEENMLFLPEGQLERKVYQDVNKCIENIGGKWNRKAQGHVFDHDPTEGLENLILTGETEDMKKMFQFFPTPIEVAEQMCKLAELKPDSRVLEPSAGRGDLADVVSGYAEDIFCVELNPDMTRYLEEKPYKSIIGVDFLTLAADPNAKDLMPNARNFTHVVMNPPFSKQQDIAHIRTAFEMLSPGGILVSVASTSWKWRENEKSQEFRDWLESDTAVAKYEVVELEQGDFKESGTMIKTVIIKIRREGKVETVQSSPTEPTAESKPIGGFSMIQNIQIIDVDKIIPHPNNPRKDLGDLTELADSIKVNGVLQNCTLVPVDPERYKSRIASKKKYDGEYYSIIGHRRTAATKLAGLTSIPCVISPDMDEKTQLSIMLVENMERSALTVYEEAQGMQMLLDLGDTIFDIAEKTGFSQTTVRRRVKLLGFDKDKFKAAEERGATLEDYAKLDQIKDEEIKNKVLDSIGTSNFDWELRRAVDNEETAVKREQFIEGLKTFAKQVESIDGMKIVQNIYSYTKFLDKPNDSDHVQYYFFVNGHEIKLLREVTAHEVAAVDEKEQREQARQELMTKLNAVSHTAYDLRYTFIKEYAPKKQHLEAILQNATRLLLSRNYSYPQLNDFSKAMGFDLTEDEEAVDEQVMDVISSNPEKSLVISAYINGMDSEHWKYYNGLGKYTSNSNLDRTYKFLEELGYEISDEEKALQAGTHELFVQGDS